MIGIRRVAGSLKNAVKSLPVNSLSRSCQLRRISESPHQTNYEESLLQRKVFRRRSKRYREEEHLIRIIEKEAYEQSWAEEDVEISRMKLERATLNPTSSSNGREIPGLTHSNLMSTELRSTDIEVVTLEVFKSRFTPLERITLGLPQSVLFHLLAMFVPENEWQVGRNVYEQHQIRLKNWEVYSPNTMSADESMDDLRNRLPPEDFKNISDLADDPPRGARALNHPLAKN